MSLYLNLNDHPGTFYICMILKFGVINEKKNIIQHSLSQFANEHIQ